MVYKILERTRTQVQSTCGGLRRLTCLLYSLVLVLFYGSRCFFPLALCWRGSYSSAMQLISTSAVKLFVLPDVRPLCTPVVLCSNAFGNRDKLSKVLFKNDADEDSEVKVMAVSDEVLEPSLIAAIVAMASTSVYKAGKPKLPKKLQN